MSRLVCTLIRRIASVEVVAATLLADTAAGEGGVGSAEKGGTSVEGVVLVASAGKVVAVSDPEAASVDQGAGSEVPTSRLLRREQTENGNTT